MWRFSFILAIGMLPGFAQAGTLETLQATLARYHDTLLAEARAEDADARRNQLPEKYARQEEILKTNAAAFEAYMAKECAKPATTEAQNTCKETLITHRLTILGYTP